MLSSKLINRNQCFLYSSYKKYFSNAVWTTKRIREFDTALKGKNPIDFGTKPSSLIKGAYGYGHYSELGLFRNMKVFHQENNEGHQIISLSDDEKTGLKFP